MNLQEIDGRDFGFPVRKNSLPIIRFGKIISCEMRFNPSFKSIIAYARRMIEYQFNYRIIVCRKNVEFAMVFSITHRCVNLIRASCYSI